MKNFIKVLSIVSLLAGCSAAYTQMSKSDMEIKTNMTKTIWLTPTNPADTTIFVQSRNTSDNKSFNDLGKYIKVALEEKGYQTTNNPKTATFVLQANVLKAILYNKSISEDKASSDASVAALGTGLLVGRKNNDLTSVLAGAGAGLATMYFDAKTKDATYIVQVDIRILEGKTPYTTVLNLEASQVNLAPEDATSKIKENIANSLSGLF
ncbi:MAG: complement resistance protein TraT [bacterium]|nr:complement resistance protein TraT [bacterium]